MAELQKVGDNTYMDENYQLYRLMPDGNYEPFDLLEESYKVVIAFAKMMARKGVTFTDEQKAQIKAMVEQEKAENDVEDYWGE